MTHGSPKKWMEGSDYKDKWSQQADDMRLMSNCKKRKDKSKKKRIGVNHNISCTGNKSHDSGDGHE